ncbi:MAG: OmpH family outer membrane protein [Selenomonadaceae bacterium]|nr:OmpH family outer membrane protein [Selenomonadaceae bacterium]
MKKIIAAFALAFSALFATGCGSEENIGYVNQNRIMSEAPQIIAIVEEGSKKADEIEAKAKADFEANPNMSDEDRNKKTEEFQRKMMGIQQAYATKIQQKLDAALHDICKEKNVSIVMDNSEMKFLVNGGIDLTDDVINKLK